MVIFTSSQTSKFISLSCFFPAALIIVMSLAQLVPPSGVCSRISLQFLDYVGIPLTYGPDVFFPKVLFGVSPSSLLTLNCHCLLITNLRSQTSFLWQPALSPPAWIWNYSGCFESRCQSIAHAGYTLTVFWVLFWSVSLVIFISLCCHSEICIWNTSWPLLVFSNREPVL